MIEIVFQAMGGDEKNVKGWQQCKENIKHCWGHFLGKLGYIGKNLENVECSWENSKGC